MNLKNPLRHILAAALFLAITSAAGAAETNQGFTGGSEAWAKVPEILARIVPPKFPQREFLITKYGAVGNGTKDCTEAIRKAIDECTSAGGGKVVVPAGKFLTGAIHLKNGVDLHLLKNATVLFTTNAEEYLPPVFARFEGTEVMNYSPFVYAFEQTNIAITGEGTLDGQGSAWHPWARRGEPRNLVAMANKGVPREQRVFGSGHYLRPNFVEPFRCQNVLIEGVKIINSPMWVLSPAYCRNVTIRNVTVDTKGPNTDGCDPDSCSDILLENCNFSDGDDCIAIKSGRDKDGLKVNVPCENMVIRNCNFEAGHGGVAIGSETSGGVRNIFAENCHFDSADLEMALRFKSNPARGGYIEDVYIRHCEIKTAQFGIHMTLRYGASGPMEGDNTPVIRKIDIEDTTFDGLSRSPIFIEGWSPSDQITDIRIANCSFAGAAEPSVIRNAARISLPGTEGSGLEKDSY